VRTDIADNEILDVILDMTGEGCPVLGECNPSVEGFACRPGLYLFRAFEFAKLFEHGARIHPAKAFDGEERITLFALDEKRAISARKEESDSGDAARTEDLRVVGQLMAAFMLLGGGMFQLARGVDREFGLGLG
jgi:hypothetical protein